MTPWHYIVENGKLRAVSEEEAKQHLRELKAPGKPAIGDSSENFRPKEGHNLLVARQAKEELAREILRVRLQALSDAVEAGEVKGVLRLHVVRVDFCAVTRLRYWFEHGTKPKPAKPAEPEKVAPYGHRYHNGVLLKKGEWYVYAGDPLDENGDKRVCDITTKDGRTYETCWPDDVEPDASQPARWEFRSMIEEGLSVEGAEVSEIRYLSVVEKAP